MRMLMTSNPAICRSAVTRTLFGLSAILLFTICPQRGSAQQGVDTSTTLSSAEISRIVTAFTSKEGEFRRALNTYAFKRDALLQSLGMGGQITGEFRRVSYFTFDDRGNRYEKISFAPMSTLESVTQEDIDDLGGINPFALEPSKVDQYNFKYVGKERIDDLNLYVFDVTPKVIPDPKRTRERLFTGRVWVDDHDLRIVKTRGKGVPETKSNKFPYVETYREEIDGYYWFPTYSYADEELIFDNGGSLHIRMKVLYSEFKPAHVTVTVREAEDQTRQPAANPTAVATTPENNKTESHRQKPVESGDLND